MAETEAIARMADKLSQELFGVFGWERVNPINQNWNCQDPDHHGRPTHPTDVAFRYEHPYRPVTVHLNVDLKSYAKGSISKATVTSAARSLGLVTHCANLSPEWQSMYVAPGATPEIAGLLFVYNHDSEYDRDFHGLLASMKRQDNRVTRTQRVYVLGPDPIAYLSTVANDILRLRGLGQIPGTGRDFWYYYPDLITVRARTERHPAASIESLTGPMLVARYQKPSAPSSNGDAQILQGALVYYSRSGDTVDEFKYLIDFLFRYQLLVVADEILLRLPRGVPQATAIFRQAVQQYVGELHGLPEIAQRLARVKVETVSKVLTRFSEIELGMD